MYGNKGEQRLFRAENTAFFLDAIKIIVDANIMQ